MNVEVTMTGTLTSETPTEDGLENVLDAVMVDLLDNPAVIDPLMSGTLTTGEWNVTVTVEADTPLAGLTLADGAIRAAFHAAEVVTAGWPDVPRFEVHSLAADLVDA